MNSVFAMVFPLPPHACPPLDGAACDPRGHAPCQLRRSEVTPFRRYSARRREAPRELFPGGADSFAFQGQTYQRKRLLPEPARSYGSIRRYGESDVARVTFVKSAQRLGFSLEEIAGLLTLEDGRHCDDARVLAEQKLVDVRATLDDLRRIESVLAQLVERCSASRGTITCPLIAALHTH